jgi:hypothetical protein
VTSPDLERARPATGPAFSDAVTFAFADPQAEVYGLARLGLSGADGSRSGSALAVLFSGREPAATLAEGGVPVDGGFEDLSVAGLSTRVDAPLERWTVALEGRFSLAFEALAGPAELAAGEPAAGAGGMTGYEQLCRVQGTVQAGGRTHEVRCFGQRGHLWGEPDWERMDCTRTVAAWLEDGTGVSLLAVRPAGSSDHAAESVWAALLAPAGVLRVDEPRLSTTYDEEGRQRRAGLELWVGEEDAYPRRAAGEAVCGSTLDLGQLRLECAFFRWRMDGRSGVGRYDVLQRA